MSEEETDRFAALLSEARRLNGSDAAPRLLQAAAALVEQAGYEIARSERSSRVTQIILLAAELDRLGEIVGRTETEVHHDDLPRLRSERR